MTFTQLAYRESLHDIETFLNAEQVKIYHIGFRGLVFRNTLAFAKEIRN